MPTVIGIDLGTTNSCVATYRHGNVEIINSEQGQRTTPSYVAFTDKGRLVGDAAKSQAGINPNNTVFDTKRLIGRKFADQSVQEDMKHWPFEVIDEKGNPRVKVTYKGKEETFAPEQISGLILERMKTLAEKFLNKTIDGAVVTVPAYFNDAQRRATEQAGKISGVNIMRVINEPTAAAIAYGFQNREYEAARYILVFDVGGGTLDVTILRIEDKVFEAKSTSGDTHLGGEDFTNRIITHVIEEIKMTNGKDLTGETKALSKLRKACEKAKRTLSEDIEARIQLESLIDGDDFETTISRAKFEELNEDLFGKCIPPIQTALDDAELTVDDIKDVVLIGGSTRIPKIKSLLKEFFKETNINQDINPDEAVAFGAAIQAAKLAGDASEDLREVSILDITPLSLGIEAMGGLMATVIPKNTQVPVTKSVECTTSYDNQSYVILTVYEGERPMTKHNNKLGEFTLTEITQAPVGDVKIDVKFEVNENGTLEITASERDTENVIAIQINTDSHLNHEKVSEMNQRAEQFRLEDELERQRVQAKVDLETLCIVLRSDFKLKCLNKLSQEDESDRNQVLTLVAQTASWIATHRDDTKEAYESKQAEVEKVCNPIRRKLLED